MIVSSRVLWRECINVKYIHVGMPRHVNIRFNKTFFEAQAINRYRYPNRDTSREKWILYLLGKAVSKAQLGSNYESCYIYIQNCVVTNRVIQRLRYIDQTCKPTVVISSPNTLFSFALLSQRTYGQTLYQWETCDRDCIFS